MCCPRRSPPFEMTGKREEFFFLGRARGNSTSKLLSPPPTPPTNGSESHHDSRGPPLNSSAPNSFTHKTRPLSALIGRSCLCTHPAAAPRIVAAWSSPPCRAGTQRRLRWHTPRQRTGSGRKGSHCCHSLCGSQLQHSGGPHCGPPECWSCALYGWFVNHHVDSFVEHGSQRRETTRIRGGHAHEDSYVETVSQEDGVHNGSSCGLLHCSSGERTTSMMKNPDSMEKEQPMRTTILSTHEDNDLVERIDSCGS